MDTISEAIIENFPISEGFRFVDRISYFDPEEITGEYTFRPDWAFYSSHFPGNPITPGSILTECCAQITLLAYGIGVYIHGRGSLRKEVPGHAFDPRAMQFALVSSQLQYLYPVLPGSRVVVTGMKKLFRFGRLRMEVRMMDEEGRIVCKGSLEGQNTLLESV